MKILFLTHDFPYPPNEGIKLYAYNLIKELSNRHQIYLLSLIEDENEKKFLNGIKDFCKEVYFVVKKTPKSPLLRLYNILFQGKPFCIYQFYSDEFVHKLLQIIQEKKPDLIHFNFVNTSHYKNFIDNKIPSVFFLVDATSMFFYRGIAREHNLLRKLYLYAQYKKMQKYENKMIPQFQKTVVVSAVDKNWLKSMNSALNINVIPYGVDANYFRPVETEQDYPSIIFRGIMNFQPNIDAAIYFTEKIFPYIKEEIPDIKFYIVGKNPVKEIKNLADNVSISVDCCEELRPYMAKTTVNICPMRSGSGMKIKILEAMAMEKPTVATKLACDGIPDAVDGENILIADTLKEFAEKVILLLKNEGLRKKIGKNARQFVMKNYTWANTTYQFEKVYQEAINQQRAGKPAPTRRGDLGRPIAL